MLRLILIFVALVLLAAAYVLYGRPLFERIGLVRPLPVEAATWRDRIASHLWRSVTVVWSYLLGLGGTAVTLGMTFSDTFGTAEIKSQIQGMLSPEAFGVFVIAVGAITFLARIRSLIGKG